MTRETFTFSGIQRPVTVSSASSLDSFIMDLPSTADPDAYDTSHPLRTTQDDSDHYASTSQITQFDMGRAGLGCGPFILSPTPGLSSSGVIVSGAASHCSIPEFLYQLTKMLTDDNRGIIEWSNGKIEVHNPFKLESHVLHKYFRHCKFASFQRQLNYFGFRKIAGKGKMAPCSYVNDAATKDLGSLLLIKRKTTTVPPTKEKKQQANKASKKSLKPSGQAPINPVLAGILYRNNNVSQGKHGTALVVAPKASQTHKDLARAAVGKGIRHSFAAMPNDSTRPTRSQNERLAPHVINTSEASASSLKGAALSLLADPNESLSQLAFNYRNSLSDLTKNRLLQDDDDEPMTLAEMGQNGFLSRSSSLVDLAMIPDVEDDLRAPGSTGNSFGLSFVDFPYVLPRAGGEDGSDTERPSGAPA